MSPTKSLRASILLLALATSGSAAAHGVRFGFHFGFPVYPPVWYYPAPVYYYPSPVVTAPAPAYVERSDTQAAPAEHWWYYCPDSKIYYPYVKECASPWQRVPPRPPG